jgi:hypothetical protein
MVEKEASVRAWRSVEGKLLRLEQADPGLHLPLSSHKARPHEELAQPSAALSFFHNTFQQYINVSIHHALELLVNHNGSQISTNTLPIHVRRSTEAHQIDFT